MENQQENEPNPIEGSAEVLGESSSTSGDAPGGEASTSEPQEPAPPSPPTAATPTVESAPTVEGAPTTPAAPTAPTEEVPAAMPYPPGGPGEVLGVASSVGEAHGSFGSPAGSVPPGSGFGYGPDPGYAYGYSSGGYGPPPGGPGYGPPPAGAPYGTPPGGYGYGPPGGPGYGPPPGAPGYGPPPAVPGYGPLPGGAGYGPPAGPDSGFPPQGPGWVQPPSREEKPPADKGSSGNTFWSFLRNVWIAWIVAGVLALAVIGLSVGLATANSSVPARASAPFGRFGPAFGGGGGGGGGFGANGPGGASGSSSGFLPGVFGTVTSVSSGSFKVNSRLGGTVTVDETSSTTYYNGSTKASSSVVSKGANVMVQGTQSGNTVTATRVRVIQSAGSSGL